MDTKKMISLLKEIRHLAQEISLTNNFKSSTGLLIKHYNSCYNEAVKRELLEKDTLFHELSEDTNIDEIGVSAALLAKYLREDD